jgi:hypothetical protein
LPRAKIGGGSDADRALLSSLNKLNERNFDAVRDGVLELISAGKVDAASAAHAMLAKSSNDSTFAAVYARLLAAIADGGAAVGTAVGAFLGTLFGRDGGLWEDVRVVSAALAVASPTEGYDAFCVAVRAKKQLLGRHGTALAVLALMAKTIEGAPRPADAVEVLMDVLGRAVALRDSVAVDLALELVQQLVSALEASGAGGPRSHPAALQGVRDGIRTLLPDELVSAEFGPKCKFKVLDLLGGGGKARTAAHPGRKPTTAARAAPDVQPRSHVSQTAACAPSDAGGWRSVTSSGKKNGRAGNADRYNN